MDVSVRRRTGGGFSLACHLVCVIGRAELAFALVVIAGGLYSFMLYAGVMDGYEKGILLAALPSAIALGWFWRPLRTLMLAVAALSLLGVASYQGQLERAESVFWLKYFLSSQSAILWMSVLFFMSTIFYWIGVFAKGRADGMELVASRLVWVAVTMALVGTMVRWYESYLLGPGWFWRRRWWRCGAWWPRRWGWRRLWRWWRRSLLTF